MGVANPGIICELKGAVAGMNEAVDCVAAWCASQGGTVEVDDALAGTVLSDGSVFYVGTTEGDWGETANGGLDFAGGMISTDGEELWQWQVKSELFPTFASLSLLCTVDSSY